MAPPATPTSTTIVTEGFKKFGIATPSSAQLTRGADYILESIKDDIWLIGKKWRSLQTIDFLPTISGVPHYQAPSDLESDLELVLIDGTSRSTLASVASASNVTLNASEAVSQGDAEGKLLCITSGTGVNQAKHMKTYNPTSKVAVMSEAFSTAPIAGDGYLIANQHVNLGAPKIVQDYDRILSPGLLARPQECYRLPDTAAGDYYLYPTPDKVYMLLRRYYANLKQIDLASTLYTRIL